MNYNFVSFIAYYFADSSLPYCFLVNMGHASSLSTKMSLKTMVRSLSCSSYAEKLVLYLMNFAGLGLLNT